jgi:hypothetical protein
MLHIDFRDARRAARLLSILSLSETEAPKPRLCPQLTAPFAVYCTTGPFTCTVSIFNFIFPEPANTQSISRAIMILFTIILITGPLIQMILIIILFINSLIKMNLV